MIRINSQNTKRICLFLVLILIILIFPVLESLNTIPYYHELDFPQLLESYRFNQPMTLEPPVKKQIGLTILWSLTFLMELIIYLVFIMIQKYKQANYEFRKSLRLFLKLQRMLLPKLSMSNYKAPLLFAKLNYFKPAFNKRSVYKWNLMSLSFQ